jgi:hypothetical protein
MCTCTDLVNQYADAGICALAAPVIKMLKSKYARSIKKKHHAATATAIGHPLYGYMCSRVANCECILESAVHTLIWWFSVQLCTYTHVCTMSNVYPPALIPLWLYAHACKHTYKHAHRPLRERAHTLTHDRNMHACLLHSVAIHAHSRLFSS